MFIFFKKSYSNIKKRNRYFEYKHYCFYSNCISATIIDKTDHRHRNTEKNMPQIVNGVAGLFVCVLVYLMIEVVQAKKTFAEIHNSFYKNLYCNVFRKLLHLKNIIFK